MQLHSDLLEQIRADLGKGVSDFCAALGVEIASYDAYVRAGDIRNLPPGAVNRLHEIMLDMERANLETYRSRLPQTVGGFFHGGKILHHLDKLAELESTDASVKHSVGPITVELFLTTNCNHRCPDCTFSFPNRRAGGLHNVMFDVSLLDDFVEDLRLLKVRGVDISGGEPTLHPELPRVISSLRAAGIDVD